MLFTPKRFAGAQAVWALEIEKELWEEMIKDGNNRLKFAEESLRLEESLKDAEGDLAEESFAEASMTHVRSASKVMGVDYLSSLTCGLLRRV